MFDESTYYIRLVCFIYILNLPIISCQPKVTLKTIVEESERALEDSNVERHMEIVAKYYFTQEKEKSVWYVAQEAAREMYNIDVDVKDLKFIEKLISVVENHYDECLNIKPGKGRAQCFYHLGTPLLDLEKGSRWIAAPELSIMNKIKFGTLYNSVATLTAHLSFIARENFKEFQNPKLSYDKMHAYRKALSNTVRLLAYYNASAITWRTDQISPPTVCDINERFWKEFTGICETRWRRSIDSEESLPKRGIMSGNEVGNVTVGDTEFDISSLEDEYSITELDSILKIADRIGRSLSPTQKIFRVQVIDNVNKKLIYERYRYGDTTSRGETLNLLVKDAHLARDVEVKRIKHKVSQFVRDTGYTNFMLLGRALGSIEE